jgi:mannose-6-phosphate isomerase-like protein (cupin superfamily)
MARIAPARPTSLSAAASARARAFSVSRASDGGFKRRGLRAYFEYRDLGIANASHANVMAHVIRARPRKAPHGKWHSHACKLQFVYVLKGWVRLEYEGVGVVTMKKGDCFVQPPNILHREIAHSKNLEVIEIVAPADFKTHDAPAAQKAARKTAKRAARG